MEEREVRLDRRVPGWAAPVMGLLAQDRPAVVTHDVMAAYVDQAGLDRDVGKVIAYLSRLGWLAPTRVRGAWAYVPAGQTVTGDPYIDLRAWLAVDPDAPFVVAGEAAALHLGYLDRVFEGPIAVWLPPGRRPPSGLREHLSALHLDLPPGVDIGPSRSFLRRRGLDIYRWSAGMAAFGPEALLAQIAIRPGSFRPWADLVAHLSVLVGDCEPGRVAQLLVGQSASSWQRAAYLFHAGGAIDAAEMIFARRPPGDLVHVNLGDDRSGVAGHRYGVTDNLVAPLLDSLRKA